MVKHDACSSRLEFGEVCRDELNGQKNIYIYHAHRVVIHVDSCLENSSRRDFEFGVSVSE